jgi:signal transduction histidine kinase
MSAVAGSAVPKPPDTRRVFVIAAAALAAGVADVLVVVTSDHVVDGTAIAVFGPLVGWSFVATGLYVWQRRPEPRFGALMTLLGFATFILPLEASDRGLVFTVGLVAGSLWGPILAHLLLSFPTGRLQTRGQRALIGAAYVLVPLAPVPALLVTAPEDFTECDGECPRNLLLVERDERLSEVLLAVGSAVVMTLALVFLWLLVAKWRSASPAGRRSLAPLAVAGATSLAFVLGFAATDAPALRTLAFASFAASPFAFLAGLVRADVSHARGIRRLMGRLTDLPARGDVRDALARALGDPALSLAFWVPDRERYVDADGAPVVLPSAEDGARAVTAVERGGRPVAAIVHDRSLLDEAETVRAAGAATALLLENQRLEAELRARIVELRASRARIVEAGDVERRRLERDLHDGAQSRLVVLALSLRLARAEFDDDSPTATLIEASIDELRESLDELRELARGIHPALLSDRGLEPAVRSLVARAPLPVELVGTAGERLPAAVETAAYFVISEGLTNIAKYARAGHATVRIERVDSRLLVEVSDDGVGGADATAGSGLAGLSDRVAALDGMLDVVSPPGAGTRLRAQLPCA